MTDAYETLKARLGAARAELETVLPDICARHDLTPAQVILTALEAMEPLQKHLHDLVSHTMRTEGGLDDRELLTAVYDAVIRNVTALTLDPSLIHPESFIGQAVESARNRGVPHAVTCTLRQRVGDGPESGGAVYVEAVVGGGPDHYIEDIFTMPVALRLIPPPATAAAADPDGSSPLRPRIEALREALASDLAAAGVPIGDARGRDLIARLYGSMLASGLALPEAVELYGDAYTQPHRYGRNPMLGSFRELAARLPPADVVITRGADDPTREQLRPGEILVVHVDPPRDPAPAPEALTPTMSVLRVPVARRAEYIRDHPLPPAPPPWP